LSIRRIWASQCSEGLIAKITSLFVGDWKHMAMEHTGHLHPQGISTTTRSFIRAQWNKQLLAMVDNGIRVKLAL
jgi:hypothetical protein